MEALTWAIRIDTKSAEEVESRVPKREGSAQVSITKLGPDQSPPSRVDMEKMLRFSQWWFADEGRQVPRDADRNEDDESDHRSAA